MCNSNHHHKNVIVYFFSKSRTKAIQRPLQTTAANHKQTNKQTNKQNAAAGPVPSPQPTRRPTHRDDSGRNNFRKAGRWNPQQWSIKDNNTRLHEWPYGSQSNVLTREGGVDGDLRLTRALQGPKHTTSTPRDSESTRTIPHRLPTRRCPLAGGNHQRLRSTPSRRASHSRAEQSSLSFGATPPRRALAAPPRAASTCGGRTTRRSCSAPWAQARPSCHPRARRGGA